MDSTSFSSGLAAATDVEAARQDCETWFADWQVDGELPRSAREAAELCDAVGWTSADGTDVSRLLFAAELYEEVQRYDDAARAFVAAVRADRSCVMQSDLNRFYGIMCRNSGRVGDAVALVEQQATPNDAGSLIADVLRKCHADKDAASATFNVSSTTSTVAAGAAGPGGADAESTMSQFALGKRARDDAAETSAVASSTTDSAIAGTAARLSDQRLLEDAAVYFRRVLLPSRPKDRPHFAIQKLLSYADAFHVAEFGSRMFAQLPVAYENGPVYAAARRLLNNWRDAKKRSHEPPPHGVLTGTHTAILDCVYNALGRFTTDELIALTHEELPWAAVQGEGARMKDSDYLQWYQHPAGQKVIAMIRACWQARVPT